MKSSSEMPSGLPTKVGIGVATLVALTGLLEVLLPNGISDLSSFLSEGKKDDSYKPRLVSQKLVLFSTPSGKLHIFNGTNEDAINKGDKTNIKSNVLGTAEGVPAYSADLSDEAPDKGFICVSGAYEVHADDVSGEHPAMDFLIVGNKAPTGEQRASIPIKVDALKSPQIFNAMLPYQLDSASGAALVVKEAGDWGFFLSDVSFTAIDSNSECPR